MNKIYGVLINRKSQALPLFHAMIGCDTTSCFIGKGKKQHGIVGKHIKLSKAFIELTEENINAHVTSKAFKILEQFVVILLQ